MHFVKKICKSAVSTKYTSDNYINSYVVLLTIIVFKKSFADLKRIVIVLYPRAMPQIY